MFDWNDLRYFLSVARHASLSGAARELGVSQSTVLRRITTLEEGLGHQLFDRLPSGYVLLTEAERIAFQEPYTKAGQRTMKLVPWQRTEATSPSASASPTAP